jgi:ATP-dependent DNA ligase
MEKTGPDINEPGQRSGPWLKYKINRSQEFVIGGYTVGNPFDALICRLLRRRSAAVRFKGQKWVQSATAPGPV